MSAGAGLAGSERTPGWLPALVEDLRPQPGRWADTLRLVVLVLATVAIGETFRMPEVAVSAYIVLFVSRNERSSTVMTALVAGVAVILAVFVTIAVFMATLSEPALRVPAIAIATFAALFLSRVSPLGPAAFAAGFIVAYGLTIGDLVPALSLQASGIADVTGPGLPEVLSIPPEEALLQSLLWLAPAVALPIALVVAANLLTGRRPVLLLRAGLADRLAACAAVCAGAPGAARTLAASARAGSARLAKLQHDTGASTTPPDFATLVAETERLALALLAWPMIATDAERLPILARWAEPLRAAGDSLRTQSAMVIDPPFPADASGAARPLAEEIARSSAAIFRALNHPAAVQPKAAAVARRLISAEAVRDPETIRFALKVTLAVMLSYASESLLAWPAIHTCVVTCFFVSLGTIGESVHKAALRVAGALIGGALGILSILLLMPLMTDLGDLLLCLAAVTLLAGWVATGSERISYAGWQIGIAYYLTVLQGYGPTLDMQTARDRVIGIVLGNLIVLVVFTTIWPVSVLQALRRQTATAIGTLGALMRLEERAPALRAPARLPLQMRFAAATEAARSLMAHASYERVVPGREAGGQIDAGTLAQLDLLMLVVRVIQTPQSSTPPAEVMEDILAYHSQIAGWFETCAAWVESGNGGGGPSAAIPAPPRLDSEGRLAWYGVLDSQLRAIMSQITRKADAHV